MIKKFILRDCVFNFTLHLILTGYLYVFKTITRNEFFTKAYLSSKFMYFLSFQIKELMYKSEKL